MHKREAQFQTNILNHFIRRHFKKTIVFETKVSATSAFQFGKIEKQQIMWLNAVKQGGALYKISDQSQGYKPFDGAFWYKVPAYLVIRFPSKHFYFLDIDDILFEIKRGKKGITEERSKEISVISDADFK